MLGEGLTVEFSATARAGRSRSIIDGGELGWHVVRERSLPCFEGCLLVDAETSTAASSLEAAAIFLGWLLRSPWRSSSSLWRIGHARLRALPKRPCFIITANIIITLSSCVPMLSRSSSLGSVSLVCAELSPHRVRRPPRWLIIRTSMTLSDHPILLLILEARAASAVVLVHGLIDALIAAT